MTATTPPTATLPQRLDRAGGSARAARWAHALAPLCCAAIGQLAAGCGGSKGQLAAPSGDAQSLAEYDLGRDAFQRGQLRDALEHVEKALEIDGDNAEAAYLGAVILLGFCAKDEQSSDCRYKEAEVYARKALDAAPGMRDAKNTLGVILVHEKRYEDAIATLKPLAEDILYESPEKSWGNLGWAYLERGRFDDAIDALGRAVAAQPLFCVGSFRLGLAFEKKGELAAARDALTKAVETDRPECKGLQEAFGVRARILGKLGDRSGERADLERCLKLAAATPLGKRCAAQLGALK
jgi:Tfp pilus assembly protein PilF